MRLKSQEKKQSIIRRFNLFRYYFRVNKLLKIEAKDCFSMNLNFNSLDCDNSLDIITIAYNNTHVLRHQINKIKENILDKNYTHIIADNSNIEDKRNEVREICSNENLAYISIPQILNDRVLVGSKSHAASLNWIYYQLVLKRKPEWFGILDHDIYPVKPQIILDQINDQSFWGKKETRQDYWYLWPGFSFFRLSYLDGILVDFSPAKVINTYVDTGGALWYSLYRKLNESDIIFPSDLKISLKELDYNFDEKIEFINNNWFHSMNASLWNKAADYSEAIDDILSNNDFNIDDYIKY